MRILPLIVLLSLLITLALPLAPAWAQAEGPTAEPTPTTEGEEPLAPLIHVVVEGENLTTIALAYGVTVEELLAINGLTADAILAVGQPLIIPGGEGEAIATVYEVAVGDSLTSVAAAFGSTRESVLAANRTINPYYQLIAGQSLTIISHTGTALPRPLTGTAHVVDQSETPLMVAARHGLSPAALAAANELSYPAYLFPGQRLRIPGEALYRNLPGEWVDVLVRPWPVRQGSTVSIYVENLLEGQPSGSIAGHPLRFTPFGDGFVALAGLDAFTEIGPTPLELTGGGNRPWSLFHQDLLVKSGGFGLQYITIPPELSHLLAPEVRRNEDAFLESIYTQFTETQYWEGLFQLPVTNTIVTAGYGDSRSYNGGPIEIFHTGVDFGGGIGTPILAPAAGVVVFRDQLELRGLTVIVDHGLGVMTGYFHLSESFVNMGDVVVAGQKLAAGGSTGLSNGPHLHWELRVMNVPVNGLQWTAELFP